MVRRQDRKQEMSMLRGKGKPVVLKFYALGSGKIDRHMEPFFVELLPRLQRDEGLLQNARGHGPSYR